MQKTTFKYSNEFASHNKCNKQSHLTFFKLYQHFKNFERGLNEKFLEYPKEIQISS